MAGGFGITPELAEELFEKASRSLPWAIMPGIKKKLSTIFRWEPRLLRPANYPEGVPGRGSVVVEDSGWRAGGGPSADGPGIHADHRLSLPSGQREVVG